MLPSVADYTQTLSELGKTTTPTQNEIDKSMTVNNINTVREISLASSATSPELTPAINLQSVDIHAVTSLTDSARIAAID